MVEVFKTNVKCPEQARVLIEHIHKSFIDYKANFDLDDCDNILRVQSPNGAIHAASFIDLLKEFGYEAEVLPDECVQINKINKQYD